MARYIANRLLWVVIVLFGVSVVTFVLIYAVPADPARMIAGTSATPDVVASIRKQLGLDQPLWVQYGKFIWRAVHGDLGMSYHLKSAVLPAIAHRFPYTLELAVGGIIAELIIGIPVGIISAVRQRSWADRAGMFFSLLGISAPSFWLGLIFLYYLAFRVPIFPLGGAGDIRHLILPSLTLGLANAAWYARLMRSNMLDVLDQNYIRTARAKGLPERTVLRRHAFKNALLPIVTLVGMDFGVYMSGVLVIEAVFGWPGIGLQAWQAISYVDIPMIMGTVIFSGLVIAVTNLVVDVLYVFIDPRIKYA